jgi:hypothetical protein
MDANDPRYQYNRFGMKGARVGQAVADILSKDQPTYTVEEILEGFNVRFAQELEKAVNDSLEKYESPFYVLALTKKEFWAENVVRNWFIPRQSAPYAMDMMIQYPNHTKTLYVVHEQRGDIKVAWSIPAYEECKSIAKHPATYHPELVKWIEDCFSGKLNLDKYDYLFT